MTSRIAAAIATAALLTGAGAASAADRCGAQVHSRFGETRAYFGNVLGACRPDGYCSAVIAIAAPANDAAYAQQLRIARPVPGAAYQVEFVAASPMSSGDGTPMSLGFRDGPVDLAGLQQPTSPGTNEFRIIDDATTRSAVEQFRARRTARWTYRSDTGPVTAYFPLAGVTAALAWIDCMGAR